MDTKKLTDAAIKAAAKEVAEFKKAVLVSDTHAECDNINDAKKHGVVVGQEHVARVNLSEKVDKFLKDHGIDTKEPKRVSDKSDGYKLKNDIVDAIEKEAHKDAHKKLHPGGDELAHCPANMPGGKPIAKSSGRS